MPGEIVDGSAAALTAVALVAGPAARASGWAADAAVALARRWPPPRRPVLVDTAVGGDDVRAIHNAAGVANDEGLVDVAEYGMSLASVRRDIGSCDVVTPGFYVPDGAVLRSVALWSRLLTEAAAGDTTLLVFVPADGGGVADLVRSLGAAIVLAEPAEAESVVEALPSPYSVLSVLVPPPPAVPAADESGSATTEPRADAGLEDEPVSATTEPRADAGLEDEPVVTAAGAEALGVGLEFTVADRAGPATAPAPDDDEPVVTAAGAEALGIGLEFTVADAANAAARPADSAVSPVSPGDEPIVAAAGAEQLLGGADLDPRRLTDEEFERIRLPKDKESRDALIAELRERQRAARMAPPSGGLPGRHREDDDVAGDAPGASSDDVARSGPRAGDDDAADIPDSPPRILMPAGESDHAREMRLEAGADDMTLDTLDPGPPAAAGSASAAGAPADVGRRGRDPGTGGAGGDGGAGGGDEGAGWGPAPRRPSRLRKGLGWTLAIVLALSILAGAWRYLAGRFAVVPHSGGAPADTTPVASPEPVAEPASREVPLPYAVALEAHTDLATAFRRLDALGNEPGLAFHITPLEREGTLYYHVMSGPVQDSASAVALRDTLVARGIKRAATPTDVRHQPLSFLVGDFGDRHNAEQSMTELRRLDLPSYYVIADAVDGYPMYRVHVGGFESPAEADVTRQLLRAAGVPDSLVTRTGSIYP